MVKAKKWIRAKEFEGEISKECFRLEEEDLPELKAGEVLCEAVYLTVDPYMRVHGNPVGQPMFGEQIAKVTASKNKDFKVGTLVQGFIGWRSHTVVSDASQLRRLPDLGGIATSTALGVLGMTGMTAYFGTTDVLCPKTGEVMVVSAAAGAVGSIVGQIGKLKGCKVIGFTGSDDKCKWLKDDLKFDHVFNYKKITVKEALEKAAPDGVDTYFDNVGGEFTIEVLNRMKTFGRMAICGAISTYNLSEENQPKGPYPFKMIMGQRLKVQGFNVMDYMPKWAEGAKEMRKWIKEGKIKYKETVTEGFDNMVEAFQGLFTGSNTGKAIVKA